MSQQFLPGPVPEGASEPNPQGQSARHKAQARTSIPSVEDCLQGIHRLNGLLALGVFTPAQANAMRANFHELLEYHRRAQAVPGQSRTASNNLLEFVRSHPELASELESLLTDEQIAMLMQEARETAGG